MPLGQNTGSRGARGGLQAAYDGPSEERGRSRSASRPRTSQPASRTQSATGTAGYDPATNRPVVLNRNIELGGNAYNLRTGGNLNLKERGPFGKAGKVAKVFVNSHKVEQWPNKDVFQYDVVVGSGAEKRGLVAMIWASKAVKQATGPAFIFDGNKIGWSTKKLPAPLRITVNLDEENGRQPRKKGGEIRPDIHRVEIRPAKGSQGEVAKVRLATLQAYMDKQGDFNEEVLKSINFLDHLLREDPSKRLINLRRSYYTPIKQEEGKQMMTIGAGVEAIKGVYQSLRIAEGKKLVINVDVSNSCFWNIHSFDRLCQQMLGAPAGTAFESAARWYPNRGKPQAWIFFKRLAKSKFFIKHKGAQHSEKDLKTAFKIVDQTAETYKFDLKDKTTGKTTNISVAQYFQQRYNIRLEFPYLPLVEVKQREVYPMEVCIMARGQRYPAKLNEDQTSKMIKFAATRPGIRKEGIKYGLSQLNWQADPWLKEYGMKINPNMLETNARILEPPEVQFGKGGTAKPMFSGRWDLRGKVFAQPNPAALQSWGVLVLAGTEGGMVRAVPSKDTVTLFIQNFLKLYKGHGGIVTNSNPVITGGIPDTAVACETVFQTTGNRHQMRPQMIMVILTNKSADVYNRVKANLDCRFGVMSQCVQAGNVVKNQPQYCSNVLMKFNLKLGGTTSTIKARKPYFTEPTMIIGADVTHPGPGLSGASIAAITVSMDRTCSRYAAAVQTNGYRLEMITQRNMIEEVQPLIQRWLEGVGGGQMPKHVYYFRDGVSEGQYIPLLRNEVADLKKAFDIKTDGKKFLMPKFTVVVAEKRHHIRMFPSQGPAADKNGNPVPGVIVDRDVTHPFEEDYYLNSHSAIQGTARPTHYHMLMDEYGVGTDRFQAMLYEHCYQYQRATTPVSLFPAVYYAHLAAARATSHVDLSATQQWFQRHIANAAPGMPLPNFQGDTTQPPELKAMNKINKIQYGMWYI